MQSDLMQVFATIANTKYSEDVLTVSKSATFHKFLLAEVLRFIDGALSLFVNFSVMLTTDAVLSVMLNFAALHFLQDIDDVFYNLVEKGFFGDRLEHMATICKSISWPRRYVFRYTTIILSLDGLCVCAFLFVCCLLYRCPYGSVVVSCARGSAGPQT